MGLGHVQHCIVRLPGVNLHCPRAAYFPGRPITPAMLAKTWCEQGLRQLPNHFVMPILIRIRQWVTWDGGFTHVYPTGSTPLVVMDLIHATQTQLRCSESSGRNAVSESAYPCSLKDARLQRWMGCCFSLPTVQSMRSSTRSKIKTKMRTAMQQLDHRSVK